MRLFRKYNMSSNNEKKKSSSLLHEAIPHIEELRKRLMYSAIVLIAATIAAFSFSEFLINSLTEFLLSGKKITLHFFDVSEPFTFRIKASFIAAVFASIPFHIYHIARFILPALKKSEKRMTACVIIAGTILFYTGAALSFMFALPQTIDIMLSFAPQNMTSSINANSFMSFISYFVFFGGIIFEMPVISFVLSKIGVLKKRTLYSKRKFALVAIWIIAAVITPPDVLSQTIAAVPMMLLYEISAFIAFICARE